MTTSWAPDNVQVHAFSKTGPIFNGEVLWPSQDNTTFYSFGGEVSYILQDPYITPVSTWQFTSSGSGEGDWKEFEPPNNSEFFRLTRPMQALGAVVDNTGFIIGGYESFRSSPETAGLWGKVQIPGIASFNMSSGVWKNATLPDELVQYWGFAAGVPIYGPRGLIIMAGSSFMYGGQDNLGSGGSLTTEQIDANKALDEVFVLSLPAFRWFKANYTAEKPRYRHTCQIVGKRQMLSIGGLDPREVDQDDTTSDPFAQGLGIFDMSRMAWDDHYNAFAEPYTTPEVVKKWYMENPVSMMKWDDPEVRKFFWQDQPTNSGATTPVVEPSSDNNSESSRSAPVNHSLNKGAIAGGTIGGVAAFAVLSFVVYFLLRRRRKEKSAPTPYSDDYPYHEREPKIMPSEMGEERKVHELHSRYGGSEIAEVDGHGKFELEDQELPAGQNR
ncbi:MAG: hypothetical protein Q9167_005176 [Letrouitia subvulpina]